MVQLREAHGAALGAEDPAGLELDDLLARIVDPVIAFNIANPGFKVVPLIVTAEGAERDALTGELKRVLHRCLAPVLGDGPPGRE